MGKRDPRVDAYIGKSAEFARPILTHLRDLVHAACPEVEETLKWSHPSFMYHGILCGMSSFKEHCAFGFWKGSLILDGHGAKAEASAGQFGRVMSVADLPSKKVLSGYIKQAMRLNEAGTKVVKPSRPKKAPLPVPADLKAALQKHKKAGAAFEAFPPGQRREYIEWITEAKRDETRARRLAQTIEWLAEGKTRNWKYENC